MRTDRKCSRKLSPRACAQQRPERPGRGGALLTASAGGVPAERHSPTRLWGPLSPAQRPQSPAALLSLASPLLSGLRPSRQLRLLLSSSDAEAPTWPRAAKRGSTATQPPSGVLGAGEAQLGCLTSLPLWLRATQIRFLASWSSEVGRESHWAQGKCWQDCAPSGARGEHLPPALPAAGASSVPQLPAPSSSSSVKPFLLVSLQPPRGPPSPTSKGPCGYTGSTWRILATSCFLK